MKDNSYYNFQATNFTNNTDLNNSSNQIQDFYDIQAEEESLMVIKTQNKKIKELYEELYGKDSYISKLKGQLDFYSKSTNDFESAKDQFAGREKIFKEQISVLQNQIHTLEISDRNKDKINSENIEKFKKREDEMIDEINNKENELRLREETIDYQEESIKQLKMEKENLEYNLKEKDSALNETTKQLKSLTNKYNALSEDFSNLKLDINSKTNQFSNEKDGLKSKIHKLVEIVQNQSTEIQETSNLLTEANKENKKLKSENSKLSNEIESLIVKLDDLKITVEKLKTLQENLNIQESYNKELKEAIKLERKGFESMSEKADALEKENFKLKELLDGKDMMNNDIYKRNLELENQLHIYQTRSAKLEKENEEKLKEEMMYNEDLRLFFDILSKDLTLALKYAETYLGNFHFHKNSDIKFVIPELSSSNFLYNKASFKNLVFNEYIKKLNILEMFELFSKIRSKLNNEFTNSESSYNNLTQENSELNSKLKNYSEENRGLKKIIKELEDRLQASQFKSNSLKDEIKEVEEKSLEILREAEKKTKEGIIAFEEVEEEIICIISNLDSIKNLFSNKKVSSLIIDSELEENPFKNFIDFDDLKEIYKLNFHNHNYLYHTFNNTSVNKSGELKKISSNSNFNNVNNSSHFNNNHNNRFDLDKYKENLSCFFGVFKSLSEEYVKCVKKLVEMNAIKKEVEIIKSDFNKNKQQMLLENEELAKRNNELTKQLELVFTDNIHKIQTNFIEKEAKWKHDLNQKDEVISQLNSEFKFLKSQIDSNEKRIKVISENKRELELKMNCYVEEKEKLISKLNKDLSELSIEYQTVCLRLKEKENQYDKINRQMKVINSNSNAINSLNTSGFIKK